MAVAAFAAAKINLYLHITGRRADGYHLVDSLVGFADIGDRLSLRSATSLSLAVSGAEAAELAAAEHDNLVLRAARLLARHAGIGAAGGNPSRKKSAGRRRSRRRVERRGGGTAVACRVCGERPDRASPRCAVWASRSASICRSVCMAVRPGSAASATPIEPAPDLPAAAILLVNPRRRLPTGAVFAARRRPV